MEVSSAASRRGVERWFVSRGVPQLISGYADERQLDARATPLIGGWLVLGTILWWAVRPEWPPARNALTVGLALAYMLVVFTLISRLRGRGPLERPMTWDLGDIATFAVLPAVPATAVHGPVAGGLAAANALLGIGIIYLVIAFGLPEIAWWAVRRVGSQLEQIVWLIARTLPLLLILVIFLLFAAEIWQAAATLTATELGLVLLLLGAIAVLLIYTTLQSELERIERRDDWDAIADAARTTPAATLLVNLPSVATAPPRFLGRERANLSLLMVISQLVQSIFVAVVVAAFLVAFGVIVIPEPVQASWAGDGVRALARFELAGAERVISSELLAVASLLGSITGLYFTGLALTDATYRSQYFARLVSEVEQIAAVRAVYLATASTSP